MGLACISVSSQLRHDDRDSSGHDDRDSSLFTSHQRDKGGESVVCVIDAVK